MEALTLHRKNSTCSSVLLACSFLIHLVLYTLKTENYKVFWCFQEVEKGRNSHLEVFYKNGVLRNFLKFIGKHACQSPFLIKLQALDLQLY